MDDIVRQALAKWPNVPHCYGWLGLDARGNWYMRDDRTQAAGPFAVAKGSLLRHDKLIDFIQRNYEHDEAGQWFFQNGPQRVFVALAYTPLVVHFEGEALLVALEAPVDDYLMRLGALMAEQRVAASVLGRAAVAS